MEAHQTRVVEELIELTDKREKLAVFIGTSQIFQKLPADEQSRLKRQFDIMVQYEGVLQERFYCQYQALGGKMLLLIIVILLLCGGGFGYRSYGPGGGLGIVGTILIIVLVLYLLHAIRF